MGNWWSRCIVLKSSLSQEQDPSTQIRYVLQYDKPEGGGYPAFIELRILKPRSKSEEDFSDLIEFLMESFPDDKEYVWTTSNTLYVACRYRKLIDGWNISKDVFSFMQQRFNPAIKEYFSAEQKNGTLERTLVPTYGNLSEVELYTMSLLQVLNLNLKIPDYQRIY